MLKMFAKWYKQMLFVAFVGLAASNACAQPHFGPNDGDTILIEKEASQKIPYHRVAKSLIKRFFRVNTDNVLSFGEGRKDNVIRHFSQLSQRTKTRFKVHRDEVEVKFTLNL